MLNAHALLVFGLPNRSQLAGVVVILTLAVKFTAMWPREGNDHERLYPVSLCRSREYQSLLVLSSAVECEMLMTPALLLTPQISSLLQSILHLEVVLGLSLSGTQPSLMLRKLLQHAERYLAISPS